MKKAVMIVITLLLILSLTPTVYGLDNGQITNSATYEQPRHTILNDIPGNYNLVSALRMTFPDVIFEQNQQVVSEVIAGQRESIYQTIRPNELQTLYGVSLYLLPWQMKVYAKEFRTFLVPNPIWTEALESFNSKPSVGKSELFVILNNAQR